MGDDKFIFYRVRSYSEVSGQLRDRECLKQSEEIVSGGQNSVFPGDDGEGSRNGDYAEERPKGETGLGKTQGGNCKEAIADKPIGDEASGGCKKKIGKTSLTGSRIMY